MIKFGIVGTGQMAATMMEALKHLSDVKVIAVSSDSADRAKDFSLRFNIPKSYHSLSDLLNDPEIDAVYIANATESHASSSIQALKSGKSVLCEKPIATSEAESKLVETESAKSGKLCMEAMWTHFLPAYQRLFGLKLDNILGEPIHLYADFGYPTNKESHPRLYSATSGSGVLLDRGVYPIALSLKLFGGVKHLTSQVEFNEDGVDTHASLLLSHQNGCYSQLAVSIQSLLQNKAVLSFTEGNVSLEPPVIGTETVSIQTFHHSSLPNTNSNNFKFKLKQLLKQSPFLRRIKSKKNAAQREYHSYGVNQYLPMLNHFCALYRAGKKESDVMPLSLSSEVLRVVEQAKKLVKSNK
jgi:predicted dehydrogenase